jgi:hypothetical protein
VKIGKIEIPEALVNALRDRDKGLVVFAGAGVSMGEPANLPSFRRLAEQIAEGTGETLQDSEPEDRFLGRLQHVDVHARAANILSSGKAAPTLLHRDLLRLFPSVDKVRIVTTNFDPLFGQAAKEVFENEPTLYRAPALPLGRDFDGIVHVHGALLRPREMVLTDADFGRAYLTEGWACRFLVEVFLHYPVLFVGYSHNDVIVSYLARALPVSKAYPRFALIPVAENDDAKRWQVLGIAPILYPSSGARDHKALYQGVARLADLVRRGMVDWRRELEELACNPPPLDDEELSKIEFALEHAATTRLFTKHTPHPDWLTWFERRHYLDVLFREGAPSDRDLALSVWLAEYYAASRPDDLLSIIAKQRTVINPSLWKKLIHRLNATQPNTLDSATVARWTCVLLATAPAEDTQFSLRMLGACCAKCGALMSAVQVFGAMVRMRLLLDPATSTSADGNEASRHPPDVSVQPLAQRFALDDLWQKCLKPNLTEVASFVLPLLVRQLEEQHFTLRAWGVANREFDSASFQRSAIEPHEQDKYHKAVDPLIDVARDCLEWMAANRPHVAAGWCELLAHSEVPLLRRLAVHTLSARTDLTADNKINWLLDRIELHDLPAHHEIYREIGSAYPQAGAPVRARIIEQVLAYGGGREEYPGKESHTAYERFAWLHWLHTADPNCVLTKQSLDAVRAKYPDFEPREHPDFTHWMHCGWVAHNSPLTVDQLVSKPASEWLTQLLDFQGDAFNGPDRDGLLNEVVEAAKRDFRWGLNLAAAITNVQERNTDLWPCLLRAWSDMDLAEPDYRQVLDWLRRPELHVSHPRETATALYSLVKDQGRPYAVQLLTEANEIAAAMWRSLDRTETRHDSNDWLQVAINHPAGILSQFWTEGLSLWRQQQNPRPKALNGEYCAILTWVTQDTSLAGRLGRAVLASHFSFLLSSDEGWTRTNLLPFFDADKPGPDFQAVWTGFLYSGHLNPVLADVLGGSFLKAVTQLDSDLAHWRERFVEFYSALLGYYADDPPSTWIPPLFKHGGIEVQRLFASHVGYHLQGLDESEQGEWWQRWLKQYWENRLDGVPAILDAHEITRMLEWLLHLPAVFPEAVALAIRTPKVSLPHDSLLYGLRESELVQQYPEAVARLLIHICGPESTAEASFVKEIADKLDRTKLDPSLNKELNETLARLGYA